MCLAKKVDVMMPPTTTYESLTHSLCLAKKVEVMMTLTTT
jgi:hypothetical protein